MKSHLYSVPNVSAAENERAEAEAHEAIKAKINELTAKVTELYKKNLALEKLRDDQAAEIVRLQGSNATLERLRAEDAAEIARLKQENRQLEQRHAADKAENRRIQQQNRELAAEANVAHQRNRELEIRHQQDAAALERLKKEQAKGGESWIWKALTGVAGLAAGAAGWRSTGGTAMTTTSDSTWRSRKRRVDVAH